MTNEEAITNLKIALDEVVQCIDNADVARVPNEAYVMKPALEIAIEALEKQDKYRWHDLRENPEDLPTSNKVFIVMKPKDEYIGYWSNYEEGKGRYHKKYNAWIWSDKTTWVGENDITKDEVYEWLEVIAWKYIEPFEE